MGCYLLLLGSKVCCFARKKRRICSIQKSDVLCFQVLLRFVPTIFHFSQCPQSSSCRRHSALDWALARAGARLRQGVREMTTIIGYHGSGHLSSGKLHSLLELSLRHGVAPRDETPTRRCGAGVSPAAAGASRSRAGARCPQHSGRDAHTTGRLFLLIRPPR